MRKTTSWTAIWSAVLAARSVSAITLNVNDPASIKSAASTVAYGVMKYYKGNETGGIPGLLPQPYYWWEAGGMWGALIDYWYYTRDTSYNDAVMQALQFQIGSGEDFMPANQTQSLGNDDQAFWGMAAMSAAEQKFPDPSEGAPGWLALAQAVFNTQAPRWDLTTCGGGLRWQIFAFNAGYDYKNSISNGAFFNIASRLGAYTQNTTYFDWAVKAWDWQTAIGLISPSYQVYDGSDDTINCTQINHIQWTYNAGILLHGSAVMWNQTTGADQAMWEERIRGIISSMSVFFQNNVMYEAACEPGGNCNTDQLSFKSFTLRWMTASIKVAPFVGDLVNTYRTASAVAAAQSCSGGTDGVTCGTKWTVTGWDGGYGVGQQLSALQAIQGLLLDQAASPVSNTTGGTSQGNPNAGTDETDASGRVLRPVSTGDKAGAAILTASVLIGVLGGGWWMIA